MSATMDYVNHPLNRSLAKCSFSFSKNRRFIPDASLQIQDLSYSLPDTKNRRTCTFGYGKKITFIDKSCAPPPTQYQIRSDFEKSPQKGFSFGYGRQQAIFGMPISPVKKGSIRLGPGEYPLPSCLSNHQIYMGIKLDSPEQTVSKTPGPGSYSVSQTQIKTSGRYVLSNYKNPLSPSYRHKTCENEHQSSSQSNRLGPGQCIYHNYARQNDRQFKSERCSKVRTFGKAKRTTFHNSARDIPGPGKYRTFSQFGDLKAQKK